MARGPGLSLNIGEKRFAGSSTPLFQDFALKVAPGSVVALLGPSGIGKSTLLRLVAGIERDFNGTIRIDNINATQAPPPGFVFQDARLLPWLTALDNVHLANTQIGDAQALAALEQVGLAASAGAFPRQLSGGMQRRVALARALAGNSRLLLLDEPLVSLDRGLVIEMQLLLSAAIEATQATVLLATHQPEDAAQLADRIVVLGGRPARIRADLAFDIPRAQRDASVVADYGRQLIALG